MKLPKYEYLHSNELSFAFCLLKKEKSTSIYTIDCITMKKLFKYNKKYLCLRLGKLVRNLQTTNFILIRKTSNFRA